MKTLTAIEANTAKTEQIVAMLEERLHTSKYFTCDGADFEIATKDWNGRRTYIKLNRYTVGCHNYTYSYDCGYVEGNEYVAPRNGRRSYDVENDL